MKALKQLCTPRKSVFDVSKRDTVLNLTHLTDDKISAAEFFEENSVTEGMRTLLIEAHRRLQGKTSQAVFKLTQAMGGGKTHNLIALGLLAKTPRLRPSILKDLPGAKELPPVRVVAFSGRETDIPNGIWGEVARQLGKEQAFKDYYQPLKAPGRSAWINLLKGEPTLILLDELPPYLDNANWQGLSPEERWWLYTMTAAATGNCAAGRNRGWRKAVRFALTENPVTHRVSDQPTVPEFFRLVSEHQAAVEPLPVRRPGYLLEKTGREYGERKPKPSTK